MEKTFKESNRRWIKARKSEIKKEITETKKAVKKPYEENHRIEAARGTVILNANNDVIAVIVRGTRLYPYKWEEKINAWNNVSGMYKWSTVNKGLREERYILR